MNGSRNLGGVGGFWGVDDGVGGDGCGETSSLTHQVKCQSSRWEALWDGPMGWRSWWWQQNGGVGMAVTV